MISARRDIQPSLLRCNVSVWTALQERKSPDRPAISWQRAQRILAWSAHADAST
jgi:hypothetical protein